MEFFDALAKLEIYNPATAVGALVYLVGILFLAWLLNRAIRFAIDKAIHRDKFAIFDKTTAPFLLQFTRIAIYVVALVIYAHLIPSLRSVGTALLAGVSVASVVIGLAAQNTLGNLVAGIALLVYRPFDVGDRVQLTAPTGVETGKVESLTLGYTVLVTFDNRRVVVPNTFMANQVTINLTSVDTRVVASIPIDVSYETDLELARATFVELARNHESVQEVVNCPVTLLGPSAITLTLRAACADASMVAGIQHDLWEQMVARCRQLGIEIPYPYTNVIMQQRQTAG
jgi:small-conductance mechanosensitive channel